ncbi:hypothetical protein M3Y97_00969500 [Aphelenchoides bicaudatus]|nr:hypothetical protein M3Y97_00969500 [Aphelenchoides bicaudatus]
MSGVETFNSMGEDTTGDVLQGVGALPLKRSLSTIFSIMVFAYLSSGFFGGFAFLDLWINNYFYLAIPSILVFIATIVYSVRFFMFVIPCQLSMKTRKTAMILNLVTIICIAIAVLIQFILWIVAVSNKDTNYASFGSGYAVFGFFGLWVALAMLITATVMDYLDAKSGAGASSGGHV